MRSPPMSFEQIHEIRTSSASNADLARELGRAESAIHMARRGLSYKDHPTPPQPELRKGAIALTFEAVHHIRTCGLPDDVLAALYGVTYACVIMARRGRSWPNHPTPPDRFSRQFGQHKWESKEALINAPDTNPPCEPANRALYDRLRMRCVTDEMGCWIWTGTVQSSLPRPSGHHGAATANGKVTGAHRAMWIAVHGFVPDELSVCHQCDKPLCLRPDHLWLGTHQDNMDDAIAKGRHPFTRGRRRTSSGRNVSGV